MKALERRLKTGVRCCLCVDTTRSGDEVYRSLNKTYNILYIKADKTYMMTVEDVQRQTSDIPILSGKEYMRFV